MMVIMILIIMMMMMMMMTLSCVVTGWAIVHIVWDITIFV